MPRKFLVTGALPYSNGRLHVGHIAGAYLPADTYVRYLRANGDDAMFVCGSDDNGVAIEFASIKEKTTPEQIVAKYSTSQKRAFDGLGINFDVYGGTHNPDFVEIHNQRSQAFFLKIHDHGLFSKKKTKQFFDVKAGKFLPDRYVHGTCYHCGNKDANGDQCENCGKEIETLLLKDPISVLTNTTPEPRETTHWFLRLNDFSEKLKEWLEKNRDSETWRKTVINFTLGQIKEGLPERMMTRDLTWGVPVPLDDPDAEGKVLYVWFDAPIGYVSFTEKLLADRGGSPGDYEKWWKNPDCKIIHFIGEDNVIFHALIWPAMLMAEGSFQLPTNVVSNCFLNLKFPGQEEQKMSKSAGTAVWIEDLLEHIDPDPIRYYLTAIAPEAARAAYEPEDLINRNDSELVAALGNFINRPLPFVTKDFGGKVPAVGTRDEVDEAQLAACRTQTAKVAAEIEAFRFKSALNEVMNLARTANLYLEQKKPWIQKKTDLAACGTTVNVCLQTIRTLMVIMQPFLPFTARKCLKILNLDESSLQWSRATEELPAGHPFGEIEVLFRKLKDEPKK